MAERIWVLNHGSTIVDPFVVTGIDWEDVASRLSRLAKQPISPEMLPTAVEQELSHQIPAVYPEMPVWFIPHVTIAEALTRLCGRYEVVSLETDLQLSRYVRGRKVNDALEVTRTKERLGLGPRLGYSQDLLSVQIKRLRKRLLGDRLALVDTGAYKATTILELGEILDKVGLRISQVFLGITTPKAREALAGVVEVESVFALERCSLWVEAVDLLPFLPKCGKPVGVLRRGHAVPWLSPHGYGFAVDFVGARPHCFSEAQKSELNQRLLAEAHEFWLRVEDLVKRRICLMDLRVMGGRFPVSYGERVGLRFDPRTPITELLNERLG